MSACVIECPNGKCKIHFTCGWPERDAFETEARGYLSHVNVETEDGFLHPVVFYDPVRLQQDLEEECKLGAPFLAERGMIILEIITLENILTAVSRLSAEGYFDRL